MGYECVVGYYAKYSVCVNMRWQVQCLFNIQPTASSIATFTGCSVECVFLIGMVCQFDVIIPTMYMITTITSQTQWEQACVYVLKLGVTLYQEWILRESLVYKNMHA